MSEVRSGHEIRTDLYAKARRISEIQNKLNPDHPDYMHSGIGRMVLESHLGDAKSAHATAEAELRKHIDRERMDRLSKSGMEGSLFGGEADHVEKFPQTHRTPEAAAEVLHSDITNAISRGRVPDGTHTFRLHSYGSGGKQVHLIGHYKVKDGQATGYSALGAPSLDGLKKYAETGSWF